MFRSMRARVTLWYAGVLALVLILFSLASYAYLARAAQRRTDNSLAEAANSFISTLSTEANDEDCRLMMLRRNLLMHSTRLTE